MAAATMKLLNMKMASHISTTNMSLKVCTGWMPFLSPKHTLTPIFNVPTKLRLNSIQSLQHLQSSNCCTLETQVSLEVLRYFTNKTLKRKLANQQLCGFLVATDFTKCNRAWPVTMWLLHAARRRCAFPSSLRRQLLARCLATS